MTITIDKLIEEVLEDVPPKTESQSRVAKELLRDAIDFSNANIHTTKEMEAWADGACAGLVALDKTYSISNYMLDVFERFMEENKE